MGRTSVRIPIDADLFRDLIKGAYTLTKLAEVSGVTKQAVNAWLEEGRIPPKVIADLVKELNWDVETVEKLVRPRTSFTITIHIESADDKTK